MKKTLRINKDTLFLLIVFCFLSACEQSHEDKGGQKVAAEQEVAAEKKAEPSQSTIRLLTSTGKEIENIKISYVSHEHNWKAGSNIIRTRLRESEGVKEEIDFEDIKQIHIKHIEFDDDPRIGAKRIEVDYVKDTETIKGISSPLGAFAVQVYFVVPEDFPVSDLSQFFKPLTGFHVNPEHKMIEDEKWLRVPLVQIKSLYIK